MSSPLRCFLVEPLHHTMTPLSGAEPIRACLTAHQGLGRQLLDAAGAWARQQDLTMMTLTTFTDVPWNGPYYARLGFEVVPEKEWTAGQRRIREHEAAVGLDAWPRVVMQRRISSGESIR